jgi:hypothetical protein
LTICYSRGGCCTRLSTGFSGNGCSTKLDIGHEMTSPRNFRQQGEQHDNQDRTT